MEDATVSRRQPRENPAASSSNCGSLTGNGGRRRESGLRREGRGNKIELDDDSRAALALNAFVQLLGG